MLTSVICAGTFSSVGGVGMGPGSDLHQERGGAGLALGAAEDGGKDEAAA